MNNKCYAKFMADMEPLIEALLNCEDDVRAPHTPSGQLKASSPSPIHQDKSGKWYFWDETWADRQGPFPTEKAAREALAKYRPYHGDVQALDKQAKGSGGWFRPCKQCGEPLKGRWDKGLKRWTLACPKCKKIRYKSTDVGSGGKESYVEVDLPWKDE